MQLQLEIQDFLILNLVFRAGSKFDLGMLHLFIIPHVQIQ
jgi:hypothetical protein